MKSLQEYYGRELLLAQISSHENEQKKIIKQLKPIVKPGMVVQGAWVICQRCNSRLKKQEVQLAPEKYYCPTCIQLGRVTSFESLYIFKDIPNHQKLEAALTWQGQLTPDQQKASATLVEKLKTGGRHMLWAVTGAGKTEMLFASIAEALANGQRVCIASPRVDVCIELAPRLQAAFADVEVVLLHGKVELPYHYGPITIATTHQLLRFRAAFQLLIIDEVDSYPFVGNKELKFAAQKAAKPTGTTIMLTATPTEELLKEAKGKTLSISYLPRRFHGYPLPEPKVMLMKQLVLDQKPKLPRKLVTHIKRKVENKQRFLIFVPKIRWLNPLERLLKKLIPDIDVAGVYAADPKRLEKVQRFRDGLGDCLLCTSILERGVTFAGIDVIVLVADHAVFTVAALVQIAGRVGRNPASPTGEVLYCMQDYTRTIKKAIKQIKVMNKKGGF